MPLFDHNRTSSTSAPRVSVFADGAPSHIPTPAPWDADPAPAPPGDGVVGKAGRAVSRIRSFEGLRGYSTRVTVALRQVGALFTLLACSATAHWAFSDRPTWHFGGVLMLFSLAFILAIAAVGTVLYAESRQQIVDQARHFAFGIVALPGAALSVFMRVVSSSLGDAGETDMFASILRGSALPLVYFSLVAIPAFVFAKYVFGGLRSVNRRGLADEEALASYMRHDGYQR
jgi:hypothetical protein